MTCGLLEAVGFKLFLYVHKAIYICSLKKVSGYFLPDCQGRVIENSPILPTFI